MAHLLDKEVTPRFPDGLTVFDAYGQWLFRGDAAPNRLRTKVLVVLHEDTRSAAPISKRSAGVEAADRASVGAVVAAAGRGIVLS